MRKLLLGAGTAVALGLTAVAAGAEVPGGVGSAITSARVSVADLHAVRHLRSGGLQSAVPEAGTWAVMLIGFGAMGVSVHRRRHNHIKQAA